MMLRCVLMNEYGQNAQHPGKIVKRRLHDELGQVSRKAFDVPSRPAPPVQDEERRHEARQKSVNVQVRRLGDVL